MAAIAGLVALRRRALGALLLVVVSVAAGGAHAQDRLRGVALVIGNGDYEHLPPLANPSNDARAVEEMLDRLGFDTDVSSDRDARRLVRDLRDFVEDAEGADVAVVYYAGHGIEAGGENFLVPVDADIAALDEAGEKLVPLSSFLEELQRTVPVAIILLDACRDNPFPPGSMVRLEAGGEAIPIAEAGLGETRGARALTAPQPQAESFGAVIGFAAEPGKAALDGAPGQNSPYAAAVLRHLETMTGEEFGVVMRMVAEEVYLKTGGAQRPWVNESLRRLLYFGAAPEPVSGEESDILSERRRLLLTIAALPDAERRQVEAVARDGGLSMDALYAMLKALGQDTPEDPAELDRLLRAQARRLTDMMADRAVLASSDAEIARLSSLAAAALGEGALETAIALNERAKARVGELERTVDDAEAQVRARRMEFAQVYARSAEAYALAFEFDNAAADYGRAFAEVERWDEEAAWLYKSKQARMLGDAGTMRASAGLVRDSVAALDVALRFADRQAAPARWATTQSVLGGFLSTLAELDGDLDAGQAALGAFRNALSVFDRQTHPHEWAIAMNNYAIALDAAGDREPGLDTLLLAAETYRTLIDADLDLSDIAPPGTIRGNYASTLTELGMRENSAQRLSEAVEMHRIALAANDRALVPQSWAISQFSLGNAIYALAGLTGDVEAMREALAAYDAAMEEFPRDRFPAYWAKIQNNLTAVLREIGETTADTDTLRQALQASDNVLSVVTREAAALEWADAMLNRAGVLQRLGEFERDRALIEQAVAVNRAALEVYAEDAFPLDHAKVTLNLAVTELALAELEEGTVALESAIAHYRKTRVAMERDTLTYEFRTAISGLGRALTLLGDRTGSADAYREAIALFGEALAIMEPDTMTRERATLHYRYGLAEIGLAKAGDGEAGQRAVDHFDRAQSFYTEDADADMYRRIQTARGEAMTLAAGENADSAAHRSLFETFELAMPPEPVAGQELVWARLQATMAEGYAKLAEETLHPADAEKAVHYRRTAADAYASFGDGHQGGVAQLGLAQALRLRGQIRQEWTDFDEAVPAYRAAAAAIDADSDLEAWLQAREGLGYVQMALATWNGETARFEEAVAAYRAAIGRRDKGADVAAWLEAQNNLALTLLGSGRRSAERSQLEEARTIWTMIATELKANGIEGFDDYVAGQIAQAEAAVAELR